MSHMAAVVGGPDVCVCHLHLVLPRVFTWSPIFMGHEEKKKHINAGTLFFLHPYFLHPVVDSEFLTCFYLFSKNFPVCMLQIAPEVLDT